MDARRFAPPFALSLFLTLPACGGEGGTGPSTPPPPEPRVTTIEVTPSEATLDRPGRKLMLNASAFDQFGQQMQNVTFVWSSSNEAVATVQATSPQAEATAESDGQITIQASADGVSGSAAVTVAFDYDMDSDWIGFFPAISETSLVFLDVLDLDGNVEGTGAISEAGCFDFFVDGIRDGQDFQLRWECVDSPLFEPFTYDGEVRLARAADGTVVDSLVGGFGGSGCDPLTCEVTLTDGRETTLFQ